MRKLDLDNEYQAQGLADLKIIMAVLKQERLNRGWSQKQVADAAGVSVSTISKYERGLFPTRVVWLAAMHRALGQKLVITRYGDSTAGTSDVDRLSDSV